MLSLAKLFGWWKPGPTQGGHRPGQKAMYEIKSDEEKKERSINHVGVRRAGAEHTFRQLKRTNQPTNVRNVLVKGFSSLPSATTWKTMRHPVIWSTFWWWWWSSSSLYNGWKIFHILPFQKRSRWRLKWVM